jgi:hypothetical protein
MKCSLVRPNRRRALLPGFVSPGHARLSRRHRPERGKTSAIGLGLWRFSFVGHITMTLDTDRIDDTVLALLYLTLHDQHRAWKGFDWDTLGRLHEKGMIDNPASKTKSVEFTQNGLRRAKELFEAMFTGHPTEQLSPQTSAQISKYPNIRVELADLGNQLWPILRRVSYAKSDADVDDAEIEQYKNEVRSSDDPVAVSRRWVHVV